MAKYRKLTVSQFEKDNKLIQDPNKVAEDETLHSVISELREEYLSDLNPEDIPNSDVSDISDSEFNEENQDLIKQIDA